MPYSASAVIAGSPEAALARVRDALLANGFSISAVKPVELTAIGPGLMSTKENPIRGISTATFVAQAGALSVQAEFGGAAFLGRFVIFFPLALGLSLWLLFGFAGSAGQKANTAILLAVAPWIILGPLLARSIRKRTEKALDALVQGAAITS